MANGRDATSAFDVVIAGATPSAIATAVRVAREGKRALLVAHGRHLGGMLTSGLNVEDTLYLGNRAPLYTEFREGVKRHYRETYGEDSDQYKTCTTGRLTFEPHVAENVLTALVESEPNIEVWRGYVPVTVERAGRLLRAVTFAPPPPRHTGTPPRHPESSEGSAGSVNGDGQPVNAIPSGALASLGRRPDNSTDGERRATAPVFVDATYEADLAALAGVAYRVGREARSEYNEMHAGKVFTDHIAGHFPIEAHEGRLNLLTFPWVGGAIYAGSTGQGDSATQSFNYRVCLTNDPDNRRLPERPATYKREDFLGILEDHRETVKKRYPIKSQLVLEDIQKLRFGTRGNIPNRKQSWNLPSLPEGGHGWAHATWDERHAIAQRHWDHAMSLLWFLQNDPELPEPLRQSTREWGIAQDEFADNGNVPYELYVREARRIVGRYVFTEHDGTLTPNLDRAPIHHDAIAITEWPMDSHECTMERRYNSLYDGKILLSEETRPGQVPYRCLLPKELDNVLVTGGMSCTHVGWGTLRLEPVWVHIGESAGYAALMALELEVPVADVPIERLQRHLVSRKVMLSFFNEFDMSSQEPWVEAVQYLGTKRYFTAYDARPNAPLDEETAREWSRLSGTTVEPGQTRAAACLTIYQSQKAPTEPRH
jgi:hypothetical protein